MLNLFHFPEQGGYHVQGFVQWVINPHECGRIISDCILQLTFDFIRRNQNSTLLFTECVPTGSRLGISKHRMLMAIMLELTAQPFEVLRKL